MIQDVLIATAIALGLVALFMLFVVLYGVEQDRIERQAKIDAYRLRYLFREWTKPRNP